MDTLQWGNRKRLRCVKVKEKNSSSFSNGKSDGGGGRGEGVLVKKRITSRVIDNNKESHQNASLPPVPSPHRLNRYKISTETLKRNRKIIGFSLFVC